MAARHTWLRKALLVVASLALAGCAGFPGNKLAKQGYGSLASAQPKVVVDYDVTFIGPGGSQMYSANYMLAEQVKMVFEKSKVFASHNLNGKGAPVHLKVKLEDKGNLADATLAGIVSGLTLTIVPTCATDEYELNIEVASADKLIKRYTYNDSMTTWIQLFLIFAFPSHNPGTISREIIENMLLNFLHDVQADGVLNQPATAVSNKTEGKDHEPIPLEPR